MSSVWGRHATESVEVMVYYYDAGWDFSYGGLREELSSYTLVPAL